MVKVKSDKSLNNQFLYYAFFVSVVAIVAVTSMFLAYGRNVPQGGYQENGMTGFIVADDSTKVPLCYDSDGGREPRSYGEARSGNYVGVDSCRVTNPDSNKPSRVTKCSGSGCFIQEVYCNQDSAATGNNSIIVENIACAGNCNYGACDKVVDSNLYYAGMNVENPLFFSLKFCVEGASGAKTDVLLELTPEGSQTSKTSNFYLEFEENGCSQIDSYYYEAWGLRAGQSALLKISIDPNNQFDETNEEDNLAQEYITRSGTSACQDSDGGFFTMIKGTVRNEEDDTVTLREDKCIQKVKHWWLFESYEEALECSGDDCFVEENECMQGDDVSDTPVKTTLSHCDNGCYDGACIPIYEPYCDEYDGGANLAKASYLYTNQWGKTTRIKDSCGEAVHDENGKIVAVAWKDSCNGTNCALVEFYCNDLTPDTKLLDCSSCSEGACTARSACGNNICEQGEEDFCAPCPGEDLCPRACMKGTCPGDCAIKIDPVETKPIELPPVVVQTSPAPQPSCQSAGRDGMSCDTACYVPPGAGCDGGSGTGIPDKCGGCCYGTVSEIYPNGIEVTHCA